MNGDMTQWKNEKWKRQMQSRNQWETLPFLLCDVNTLRFSFLSCFFKILLSSECVCCLAPLDHIQTASVDPKTCFPFSVPLHTRSHTSTAVLNCCIRKTHTHNTVNAHSAGEPEARRCFTIQTNITFLARFPAQTLQFVASCVFVSTVNTDTI